MRIIILSILIFFATSNISFSDPLDYWKWRNPLPQGNTLRAVTYSNNMYVAVGYYGTVIISKDGFNWVNIYTNTSKNLFSVTYGQGIFVAVGEEGTILTSRNAMVWTSVNSGISQSLFSITYGMGRFVAVGQSGIIAYSIDGFRWTVVNSITNYNLNGICYDGNNFYAGGGDLSFFNTKYILFKSYNLTDWQKVSEGDEFTILSVSCVNNKLYAVGLNIDIDDYGLFHQTVAVSQDYGLTFDIKGLSGRGALYGLTDFKGQRIGIGNDGDIVTSRDDINWEYQNNPVKNMLFFSLASSDITVVAVGDKGRIIISTNGKDWLEASSGVIDVISDMVYCDKKLIAVTQKGTVLNSNSGINWIISRDGDGISLNRIICTEHGYLAVGNKGLIITSQDGINWTLRDSTTDEPLYGVIYQNNKYVVVGGGKMLPDIPTNIVLTSNDGIIWRKSFSEIAYSMKSVTYGNGRFVAIAENTFVYISSDGESWSRFLQEDVLLNDITFTDNMFLSVGGEYDLFNGVYKGVLLSSFDGVLWNKEIIHNSGFLNRVKCLANVCLAVGEYGNILTKTGQNTWHNKLYRKNETFKGIEYYNNSVFVMGHSGTILQSNAILDDVDENNWSYFHINRLFKNAITYGCGIFKFCPYRYMTRGEASAFIIRAKYGEEFTYPQYPLFADVGVDNIFFKYVQKLKAEAITKSEGIYFVDNYITRGEMAALLIRSLFGEEFTYPLRPYFLDVTPSHPFFKYIQKLKYEGFTTMSQWFDVDGYLSREQAAAFISRAFTLLD